MDNLSFTPVNENTKKKSSKKEKIQSKKTPAVKSNKESNKPKKITSIKNFI